MAAPVVYKDVKEDSDFEFAGKLFAGKKFWVAQRVPSRNRLLDDIKANGGEIVPLEKKADYLIADHFRRDCPPGSISYEFVDKSIKQGELRDPNDHRAGPPLGEAREPGAVYQPTKSGRTGYTAEDDRILYQWVRDAERNGSRVSGNDLYKQLEQKYPRHTWQSWRDRYLKQLKNRPPSAFDKPSNAPPSPTSDQSSERMPPAHSSSKTVEQPTSKNGQTTVATEPSMKSKPGTEHDYSVDELEGLFSTDDWLELYAFADLIDSVDGKDRYHSAWVEWAEFRGSQTATQWRQYFEKVVRPQWLHDPESKRDKIKKQIESKNREVGDDENYSVGHQFSQTSKPTAEAPKSHFDHERFEDLINDKVKKGIPAGYKFYAREKKQHELDAEPNRGFTALHVHLLKQWHTLSKEEQTRYIAMNKKTGTDTEDQTVDSAQTVAVPKGASSSTTLSRTQKFGVELHEKSVKRLRDSEEREELEEEIEVSRPVKRRKSRSPTPTDFDTLRTPTRNLGTQQQPLEISSAESTQDTTESDAIQEQIRSELFHTIEDDEVTMVEPDGQTKGKEVESVEPDRFPEENRSPLSFYETCSEDALPSNTPTPRATRQKVADFDIQAILFSPNQHKFSRPSDAAQETTFEQEPLFSSPQLPASDASTAQSIEEFRRSLQEEDLAQPIYSQYPPEPLHLSSPARSIASSISTGSGDPDPPLNADEITEFYDEQNGQGFSNEFISAALKRTNLRPELTVKVLDAWRYGKPLPDERGIWSKEDDAAVESGDGLELAKLGKKHTVDGWGGVTERLVFLEGYRNR